MKQNGFLYRSVAVLAVLTALLETPKGCDKGKPIGSGGVKSTQAPEAETGEKKDPKAPNQPYPTKKTDRKHTLTYGAIGQPRRQVDIKWRHNNSKWNYSGKVGEWSDTRYNVSSGDHALMSIHQTLGATGHLRCFIMIDGKMYIPPKGSDIRTYHNVTDSKDCWVYVIVP